MDYKYIDQLLERYWDAETSVEEENILKAFFNQTEVPAELEKYRALFAYQNKNTAQKQLGSDFDERILAMTVEDEQPQKVRHMSLHKRLRPLFRAAASVAIVLSIGQAAQVAFQQSQDSATTGSAPNNTFGTSVAIQKDSAVIDSMRQSNLQLPQATPGTQIIMPAQQE